MDNPSGIQPTHYKVLVAPKMVDEKTDGGLYLPEKFKEKQQHAQKEGILLAVSPLAFTYAKDWPEGSKPQVGDRVLFSRYAADEVTGQDGETYWLMQDECISAVMK